MPRPPAPTPATERAAARVVKRGRSRDRTAYNAAREAGVDPLALHAALEHHLDEQESVRGPAARAAASSDTGRWVPIGPSVIRRGQAVDRPHVVGRIRDLAVSEDGQRAYAASAKGGLWHTDDAGATWAPIGTWAGGNRRAGGNTSVFVCGALLVDFGPSRINDFVMVGTGELSPFSTRSGAGRVGGVGILTALGPAFFDDSDTPWEPDTGIDLFEGHGIYRLARRPGRTSGTTIDAATRDEVLAATSDGLFLGVRGRLPAVAANPPFPALAARDGFEWSRVAGIAAGTDVTDVCWVETAGGTRIIALIEGQGVEFSNDDGASFAPVPTLHRPGVPVQGRCSISIAEGNRAYVLYGHGARPAVQRIPDLTAATPTATRLTGVPTVWASAGSRDYDQAIAAETFDGTDRLYLGGDTVMPRANTQWSASLWAMDVVGNALRARPGVSDRGAPPAAGADQARLVGNNVHADVHAIALPGPTSERRPVWVACDGGVYVSAESGRVNTFAAVNTGLSVSETGFLAQHPVASHFVATGLQDNGTAVRTGDTVWEAVHVGDGGGLAFAPTAPDVLVAQYIYGFWRSSHASFRDPLTRTQRGPSGAINGHPEYTSTRAEFYANCAVVRRPGVAPAPDTSRLALGTDRVYLADNIASGSATVWAILPVVPSTEPAGTTRVTRNPHAGNQPSATFGTVPGGAFGNIVSMAWTSPTELVVIYAHGILRQTEVSPGRWSTDWLLDPNSAPAGLPVAVDLTEVAGVPGSRDFYVTTTGDLNAASPDTAYFFNATTGTFHATDLRTELGSAPLGPLDPAYSVVVDPGATTTVYVGTATGVWRGTRTSATGGHDWAHFANGLPEATVQDLSIWTDPGGGAGPRLLRAAIQSRGVWETDLAADTPVVTYLRCHSFDDRRGPLPAQDPRASATALAPASSPDIGIRPAWPVAAAPPFPQVLVGSPDTALTEANAGVFNTWTFQTAFRWWYPSVRADGQWTDAFKDLIQRDRQVRGMPGGRTITRALWEAVVGDTRLRLDAGRLVRSGDAAHDLAVFRPPWQTALGPDLLATEIDIMECVVPTTSFAGLWSVPARPSVVEVLLHHRASEPTADFTTYAGLLWKEVSGASNPLTEPAQDFVDWWDEASELFGDTTAAPAGWTVVRTSPPASRNVLDIGLDARLPRAVPIPLDLTPLAGRLIVLAAFSSSLADNGLQPAPGGAATLTDLVRSWPHVAVRLVQVV